MEAFISHILWKLLYVTQSYMLDNGNWDVSSYLICSKEFAVVYLHDVYDTVPAKRLNYSAYTERVSSQEYFPKIHFRRSANIHRKSSWAPKNSVNGSVCWVLTLLLQSSALLEMVSRQINIPNHTIGRKYYVVIACLVKKFMMDRWQCNAQIPRKKPKTFPMSSNRQWC